MDQGSLQDCPDIPVSCPIYNTRTTAILITVLNWLYKPCDESEKLYLIFVSELLALDDSKLRAGTYDVPNKKILK